MKSQTGKNLLLKWIVERESKAEEIDRTAWKIDHSVDLCGFLARVTIALNAVLIGAAVRYSKREETQNLVRQGIGWSGICRS